MEKEKRYKCFLVFIYLIGSNITLSLYLLNLDPIINTIFTIDGAWLVILIILIRMVFLLLMSKLLFKKWFNQEKQFFSDIPILFASFFSLVFFGKAYDLLYDLTYHFINRSSFLFILKLRFIILILSIAPMYYLSIIMIKFFLSIYEGEKNSYKNKLSEYSHSLLLILIVLIESIIILLFLNEITGKVILPGIAIPSFLMIVVIFFLAYKNQKLSQVNPLILTIGFGCYLVSQVIRPLLQLIFGETFYYVFSAELIDLIIFLVIFLGLITKIDYKSSSND